ncbi:MAG: tetratricopeptide repeat protein [Candidatus Brocadiia bacterium]
MDKRTIKIQPFKSAEEFRAWWDSDETKNADPKLLREHPLVKPWLEQESVRKNDDAAGQTFGKYRLERKLGQGGMGAVHLAYDSILNRHIAIKTLILEDIESTARFMREARATANLKHANIINVYEAGAVGKTYYLTMDYIEGASLADLITDGDKSLTPKSIARIIRDIALALDYAHSQNIIHRDIKPGNILIDKSGKPYLTDFGLAKQLNGLDRSLTMSGSTVGTPDYMSPEQARGEKEKVDRRSDVFSLGAALYHALTGQLPFPGAELYDVLSNVVNKEPALPSSVIVVHKDLETICLKCLEKEQLRRYQTAGELADDLNRYIEGEPILARRVSSVARLWRNVKKHRIAAIGLASTSLLLLAFGVWQLVNHIQTGQKLDIYKFEAQALFDEGKYNDSRVMCEKVLELAGYNIEIDQLKDRCLAEIRKRDRDIASRQEQLDIRTKAKAMLDRAKQFYEHNEKIKAAQQALIIDPTYAEACQFIADTYNHIDEFEQAYKYYARAVEIEPTLTYAYFQMATILNVYYNKPKEAAAKLEQVLKYDPDSAGGYYARGDMERERGNYEQAIKYFSKSLELKPDSYYTCYMRGYSYSSIGDYAKALEDYSQSVKLDPGYAGAYDARASVYHRLGLDEQALADLDTAIKIKPSVAYLSYVNRAEIYRSKKDLPGALEDIDRALKIKPDYAEAYNIRGLVRTDMFNYQEAIDDYTEAIRLDPYSSEVGYVNRAETYKQMGKPDKALEDLNRAVEMSKKSASRALYLIYLGRGEIHLFLNNFDNALADFDEGIRLNPKYADLHNARGMVYYEKAKMLGIAGKDYSEPLEKSHRDFDRAIELKPDLAEAYINRSRIYAQKGQFKLAIADAETGLKLDPDILGAGFVKISLQEWSEKLRNQQGK